jgi:hypothetical protein
MEQSQKWRRAEGALFRQALDDVVILVPGPEAEPFALAGGADLWRLLEQPLTTEQLLSALTPGLAIGTKSDAELARLLARLADVGAVDRMLS